MRATTAASLIGVLAVAGLSLWAPAASPADGAAMEPPSTSECVRATNGSIVMPGTRGFTPNCVVVEPGQRIQWINADNNLHDPGDGAPGDDTSECFEASDFVRASGMSTTDTFGGELHFDGGGLTVENITYDGETPPVDDTRQCGDDVWTRNEDGDVALGYICHIHDTDGRGWIVVDT